MMPLNPKKQKATFVKNIEQQLVCFVEELHVLVAITSYATKNVELFHKVINSENVSAPLYNIQSYTIYLV